MMKAFTPSIDYYLSQFKIRINLVMMTIAWCNAAFNYYMIIV